VTNTETKEQKCIAILGGSFDPVHIGHVVLAETMCHLLKPSQVRIMPSGWSWQKNAFHTSTQHRLAMLTLAFKDLAKQVPLCIDEQEIKRAELGIPSFSIDTLTNLRNEYGASAALVFIIGADQLLRLQSWKNWEHLFDLAHIAVATRPGFDLNNVNSAVAAEFKQRTGSIEQLRTSPFGHTFLCRDLALDISSTEIRHGATVANKVANTLSLIPPEVLSYIQQHHLF
jgi:nicotinate-nucleotide adenylyltransferase